MHSTTNSHQNTETSPNLIEHFWKAMAISNPNPIPTKMPPMETPDDHQVPHFNENALKMMIKMGYKSGRGLGKNEKGHTDPVHIPMNLGTRGFGFKIPQLESNIKSSWDFSMEKISVQEELTWISSTGYDWLPQNFSTWIVKGPMKLTVEDETHFCDPALLHTIFSAKGVFDELDQLELCKARSRANPFETIRSVFFMNRAALKMANIDAVTNFIFTEIDRNPRHSKRKGPYYFADACAGPGGFSEYVLWRKKWLFKGFGFTLRAEHDFELDESQCASPVTFGAMYGFHEDGDICCPDNITHFSERVLHETDGCGVHFMMSDGGFSVEGNENIQEILSKQLYLCQCLMALEIVRPQGHFVTKLFDLFTPFSVGLIFLMYNCFEKIALLKPNTSRPANSERYLICYGLKSCGQVHEIRAYLRKLAQELWRSRQVEKDLSVDIREIVPLPLIKSHKEFYMYVMESNNKIGAKQVTGLLKLAAFCRNPTLIEPRQEELRAKCLEYWRIPDKPKVPLPRFTTDDLLKKAVHDPSFMFTPPKQLSSIDDISDWCYVFLGSHNRTNICNFYAGVGGSRVYRLQNRKWVRVKRLRLIRGTLLYGEMIREHTQPIKDCKTTLQQQSLHVIDALRLGDVSLADLQYDERRNLIETYCQAVNHDSQTDSIRVRAKSSYKLQEIEPLKNVTRGDCEVCPVLGFGCYREYYEVNSVLLLQIGQGECFKSTYVSRVRLVIKDENSETDAGLTLQSVIDRVENAT